MSDEQETDHDGHQHVLHHNGQHDGGGPLHRSCPQNLERTFAALCNIIFQVEYLKLKLQIVSLMKQGYLEAWVCSTIGAVS